MADWVVPIRLASSAWEIPLPRLSWLIVLPGLTAALSMRLTIANPYCRMSKGDLFCVRL